MDDAFLAEQGVTPWMELPLWLPGENRSLYANKRAKAQGLSFRPLAETIRATLAWHLAERGEDYTWQGAGLASEKEARVLAAWHARDRK